MLSSSLQRIQKKLGPLGWGTLLVFTTTRCADLVNLVIKIYLGRVLDPVDFGAIEPVFSIIMVVGLPVAIAGNVVAKSISRMRAIGDDSRSNTLITMTLWASLATGAIVFVITYVARPLLASRLYLPVEQFGWVIAALCSLAWIAQMSLSLVRGTQTFRYTLIHYAVSPACALIATLILVEGMFHDGLRGALVARIIASAITVFAMAWCFRKSITGPRAPLKTEWAVMGRSVLPMTLFWAGITLLMHFDRLFVRNFLPMESGGFGAIVTFGTIPVLAVSAVSFVVFPIAAAEHALGRGARRQSFQALGLGVIATLSSVFVFVLCGEWLLRSWHTSFVPYAKLLWPYALAMGLQSMILIVGEIELARHRYAMLWALLIGSVLMCATIYLGRPYMDLARVIGASIVGRVIILGAMVAIMLRQSRNSRLAADAEQR